MDRERGREFSVQPQPAINQQRHGHSADLSQLQSTGLYKGANAPPHKKKTIQDRVFDVLLPVNLSQEQDASDLLFWR